MSTKTEVTREDAVAVLEAIKKQYPDYVEAMDSGPVLLEGFDGREFTILWEEGPYEWPFRLGGGLDEEATALAEEFGQGPVETPAAAIPEGILVEPINHYSVGVYPA